MSSKLSGELESLSWRAQTAHTSFVPQVWFLNCNYCTFVNNDSKNIESLRVFLHVDHCKEHEVEVVSIVGIQKSLMRFGKSGTSVRNQPLIF